VCGHRIPYSERPFEEKVTLEGEVMAREERVFYPLDPPLPPIRDGHHKPSWNELVAAFSAVGFPEDQVRGLADWLNNRPSSSTIPSFEDDTEDGLAY